MKPQASPSSPLRVADVCRVFGSCWWMVLMISGSALKRSRSFCQKLPGDSSRQPCSGSRFLSFLRPGSRSVTCRQTSSRLLTPELKGKHSLWDPSPGRGARQGPAPSSSSPCSSSSHCPHLINLFHLLIPSDRETLCGILAGLKALSTPDVSRSPGQPS